MKKRTCCLTNINHCKEVFCSKSYVRVRQSVDKKTVNTSKRRLVYLKIAYKLTQTHTIP